jgi:hypothetical protein
MTKGEYRVGLSFNPSASTVVDQIKTQAAALIDLIETIQIPSGDDCDHATEVMRLRALAQTAIEEAAMWAVKAATKQPKGK